METGDRVLQALAQWERDEGTMPRELSFFHEVLTLQLKARARIGTPGPALDAHTIGSQIRHGEPLLRFSHLAIDWALLRQMLEDVAWLITRYDDVLGERPCLLELDPNSLPRLSRAWFDGDPLSNRSTVSINMDCGTFLSFVIGILLKPYLTAYRDSLCRLVDEERWRLGYCPICGGNPDFAFLDKERGARHLVCARCDAEWLFQRLECPYCGNRDQRTLSYFTDDRGLYRLYVCDSCHRYLKAVDLRQTDEEVLLPLQRFLTADLDLQGHQQNYYPIDCYRSKATASRLAH
ncbi:MAG: formate dehydrogenase accessory protein FdhE [Chloroflexi bacterium]|nr:formate dehydrogenase accessory protein FdhE [Chloroflexota bacterium]